MKKENIKSLLELLQEMQVNVVAMMENENSPAPPPEPEKVYLNQKESAKFLNVSVPTFRNLKSDPMFPRAARIRKQYRYDREDLILFINLKKEIKWPRN
jgi:hypothetical protein